MGYKLFGANPSPFVRKVRVYLAEKGIEHEQEQVIPFAPPPDFRERSPLGKIPYFEHDGRFLADSSVILAYLERRHPDPPLVPEDDYEYARCLWFEEWSDGGLISAVAPVFFQRFVRPNFFKEQADEALVKEALDALPDHLGYLEKELADGRDFLAGGRFSVADIAVGSAFVNLFLGGERPDAARFPKLAAYLLRVHSRPSFKPILEGEGVAVGA